MSRKSNNLRRQLTIAHQRANRQDKEIRQVKNLLAKAERLLRETDRSLAHAVMIEVEQERHRVDLWNVHLTFSPDEFAFRAKRRAQDFMNYTLIADELGYRIGHMASRAIVEKLAGGSATNSPAQPARRR